MYNPIEEPQWDDVKKWASAQAEDLLVKLKTPRLDHADTQFHRGALFALDELLKLEGKKPAPVVEAGPSYWPDRME